MRSLLNQGRKRLGWTTLWVPSYFCQTVLRDLEPEGIAVRAYGDSPLDGEREPIRIENESRGAILTLNPFGLRSRMRPLDIDRSRMSVIEDHTHDPWSPLVQSSIADYCIASLRKTIPIPDGGILWSPQLLARPSPPLPTEERTGASAEKLAGMALKHLYLTGRVAEKTTFRELVLSGEERIASGEVSGMPFITRTLLTGFNAAEWRKRRSENYRVLIDALGGLPNLKPLSPSSADAVPFGAVLVLPSARCRTDLRQRLIESNVYPALLWSMESPAIDGIRPADLDLSRRSLFLHCDGRYGPKDMTRLAKIVSGRFAEVGCGT